MNYSDVVKVEVFTDYKTVNEYLNLGWTLLSIYTTAYDTQQPGCNHQTANYILGWKYSLEREYPVYPNSKS